MNKQSINFPYENLKEYHFFQVHGPITKEFALNKLAKLNFKRGAFLIRQSAEIHGKVEFPLHFI